MGVPAVTKVATAEKRRRRERGSINPDDIVSGAFELAERVSIDNLSMPMLGKHLDVGVTSIYWYFRKKDDLLDAMTDLALRQYALSSHYADAENWRPALRSHAHAMRQILLDNPVMCDLILIRSPHALHADRSGLQTVEQAVGGLVEAGLAPETALDVYVAISAHVRGSVVLERLRDKTTPNEGRNRHRDATSVDPGTTPLLAQALRDGQKLRTLDEVNFDFGLGCILDHAERLIAASSQPARSRRQPRS
ncbi:MULTISPECIES: TetR/AcrR family transcriptional regulator [Mycolicibacterium]|uniref:TetR/AcrR family transcriptional regulator n=1 Tax=Mycolicibacterium TaxID=1866885 RepID=UPI000F98B09B|nr:MULTISPECIES: TetR/AcrR family transcriptional regulator C-terminal domain-containing protein [Mycolicibacterium]RUP27353.1 MAG: TetR family transcriptional regulator [Mycolicibacterium sp.]UCZ58623.1 TetR/AcrR family transcriptional regulator C-terminal domain-containing protein [Mycolicibacterium phocaicum]